MSDFGAQTSTISDHQSTQQEQADSILFQEDNGNGNGLLFHMTQLISRSTIKAIACSKPTISEH